MLHVLPLFSFSKDDTTRGEKALPYVPGEIVKETVQPFKVSDEEPVNLRSVSDFEQFASSDEVENSVLAAIAIRHVSERKYAMVWNGQKDSSGESDDSDDTMPYNWSSGCGRSRGRSAPLISAPSVAGINLPGRARGRGKRTAGSSQP